MPRVDGEVRRCLWARMIVETDPGKLVEQLVALLQVEPLGNDRFEGARTPKGTEIGSGRVFGGQVIAQALAAAEATVPEGRLPNSLHAYFLRMGDEAHPISYDVTRDLDGGSFANRRVVAHQGDRRLLTLSASFHRLESGVAHRDAMPAVPPPEDLPDEIERRRPKLHLYPESRRVSMTVPRPIEMRRVEDVDFLDPQPSPPVLHTWLRAVAPLGDDPRTHRAVLAYASDMPMLPTATGAHGLSWVRDEILEASLDHAIWFHDDFRADEWLLQKTHSSWTGRGRGLISGHIFARDGRLVASVMQEGMIRLRK